MKCLREKFFLALCRKKELDCILYRTAQYAQFPYLRTVIRLTVHTMTTIFSCYIISAIAEHLCSVWGEVYGGCTIQAQQEEAPPPAYKVQYGKNT